MKTKEQILTPYLFEDSIGDDFAWKDDALTAMDEYLKSFFDWFMSTAYDMDKDSIWVELVGRATWETVSWEHILQEYGKQCEQL